MTAMYYHLTLKKATGITHAVIGNFSGREQEIVVAKGKVLELLIFDKELGRLRVLTTTDVFGEIRSIKTFRPYAGSIDYLVIGSVGEKMFILQYDTEKETFIKLFQENCSEKERISRLIGQHIAVDSKGRAIMMGAIEDSKCVFGVGQSSDNKPFSLSEPVFHENSLSLLYDMVGVDDETNDQFVWFACLGTKYKECDVYEEDPDINTEDQMLSFYKFDLESNQVTCVHDFPIEERSNSIVRVPGGCIGPGGVLVFSEDVISYRKVKRPSIWCPIPRPMNDDDALERSVIFACYALHLSESSFFFLAQSEFGDIFRIDLPTEDNEVVEIQLRYIASIPVASAICILNSEFLFVASEFSDHALYKFKNLDHLAQEPIFSSSIPLEDGDTFFFCPQGPLHLQLVQSFHSLSPIMHCRVLQVGNVPRLCVACGKGPRSTVRILKRSLEVETYSRCSLPKQATGVWTIKLDGQDFIVVSFADGTEVFSADAPLKKVPFSKIDRRVQTLSCKVMKHDVFVQVAPSGINVYRNKNRPNWKAGPLTIVACAMNDLIAVAAMSTRVVLYFEISEVAEIRASGVNQVMDAPVTCIALSSSENTAGRAKYAVIGMENGAIYVMSLVPGDNFFCGVSQINIPVAPTSLLFAEVGLDCAQASQSDTLQLFIGLQDGYIAITRLDENSGQLSKEGELHFEEPLQMFKCPFKGQTAIAIVSSHTWLYFRHEGKMHLRRLAFGKVGSVCSFPDQQLNSFVIAYRVLRKVAINDSFDAMSTMALEYTPRKFVLDPQTGCLFIIETEYDALTKKAEKEKRERLKKELLETAETEELASELSRLYFEDSAIRLSAPCEAGLWASVIRTIHPIEGKELHSVPLEQNRAAFSLALVSVGSRRFLFVGSATDLKLGSGANGMGSIHIYAVSARGVLEPVCEVEVEGVPVSMAEFGSKVLVGTGKTLRLFGFEENILVEECSVECVENRIVSIVVYEDNIIVGDLKENFVYARYNEKESSLTLFGKDQDGSYLTTACIIDSKHIARADKFGNIFIVKFPIGYIEEVPDVSSTIKELWDKQWISKYPPKSEIVASFYVAEMVTSLEKTCLFPGGLEVLLYTTLSGSIGIIGKPSKPEDLQFLELLANLMVAENPSLCSTDPLTFRSRYHMPTNIVDGDLCEHYENLAPELQQRYAETMELTPELILRKLGQVRSNFIF